MKKGYAMYLHADQLFFDVNDENRAKIKQFNMELSVVFKRKIRKSVQILKDMYLDINQTMKI